MKLPRDIGGEELASILRKYGYNISRQTGSHMRLTSTFKGNEHHITIPNHSPLRTGTLHAILYQVASYLEVERRKLLEDLFP
jgi:predicted RNA binding protein YcfA (HicA-like mRNA interferase family)